MEQKQWLVVHTRPQWERIVCRQLDKWYGIAHFCPFHKVKRRYTDRTREMETPLFKNYVFVQVDNYKDRLKVLQLDGVVNYVRYLGQPASMQEKEIETLREIVRDYMHFQLTPVVIPGRHLKLKEGVLEGFTGIVQEVSKNKVYLELPQLGFKLEAWMDNIGV